MHEAGIKKASFRSEWTSKLFTKPVRWRALGRELLRKEGRLTLLLVTLGISASLVDDIIDLVVLGLNRTRKEFLQRAIPSDSLYAEYAAWSAFTIVVATASVKWTAVFDPMAAGSGIPEMKSIISYERREDASRSLRARTLVSKIGGLALALGSGVSVGKEGPFVHTSSIIAHRLMKHVKCFRRIYDNDFMRRHVYDAACAVGVTTTFRAPIGGALFAIEVTSTVFMVSNYWRAFVASISALLAREAAHMVQRDWVAAYHAMFATHFVAESFAFAEIVAFTVLAVLTGLLGALYASTATAFRLQWNAWATNKSAVLTSLVLLFPLAALLCLPIGMTRLSFGDILADLTGTDSALPDRWHADLSLSVLMVLPLSGLIRLVVTAMSFSLPVPSGDFLPTFIAGATFGRYYGEVLRLAFPGAGIVPGGYALAGGAGFVASTTNTASVAVIALEFTGQFVYTIPLILSTLIASGVGCAFRVSVYDSVIAKKGFRHMRTRDLQDLKARDVMLLRFPVLTLEMATTQLEHVIKIDPTLTLPLVENLDSMVFIGCVPRRTVEQFIQDAELGQGTQLHSALQMPQQEDDTQRTATQSPAKDDKTATFVLPTDIHQAAGVVEPTAAPFSHDDSSLLAASDPLTSAEEATNAAVRQLIDSTALQVDPDTSLQKVHLLFEMIKCSSIWVTRRGRLVGLLHRQNLHARITELKQRDGMTVCPSLPGRRPPS
ncbi:Dipeptidyl peptidase 2 [Phytophthora pseudosyringae]|uniref:Dipeptidyl peptidase 2 n=1 Tax=Phytophthora pseudosyringae TaxID=221518 RepID=A0A8T1WG56_9STRA|nr:Dipeptidyl peptidase 2 [Phytophthora pseudosyringae]